MAKKIKCSQCNAEFYGNANAMYCSNSCKQKGYRSKIDKGVLYALFLCGDIVYIGKSKNKDSAEKRVSQHRNGSIYDEPKIFDFYEISDELTGVSGLECEYIAKLQPPLNKSFPVNSEYITRKKLISMMSTVIDGYIDENVEMIMVDERYGGHISISDANSQIDILKIKLNKEKKNDT